jgi:predicted nucleic acid-binding protein
VAALVDTNVLVYRFDARFPQKQAIADSLLREGIAQDSLRVSHQAIVEFFAATTRPQREDQPILDAADARREAEDRTGMEPAGPARFRLGPCSPGRAALTYVCVRLHCLHA